ncbi:MAG: VWA domain-containing protein [Acidobacteria bacterium]|nr:VWA domain-containing protein [Acidobacteriota bacterium]
MRKLLLILACVAAALSAQDPVFRSETALIEVEVRALDRQGRPIPDLKAEDFRLFENGEPQPIRFFEYVASPTDADAPPAAVGVTPARPADPGDSNPGRATGRSAAELRNAAFLYIAARGGPADRVPIVAAIRKFLGESLRPGLYVSLEGRPFTADRAELEISLDEMLESSWSGGGGAVDRLDVALDQETAGQADWQALADLNSGFGSAVEEIAGREEFYRRLALYRYLDLIQALSAFPGKKMVVLFSRGLTLDEENLDIVNRFASEAMRNRVVFYTADVKRLTAGSSVYDAEESADIGALMGDPTKVFNRQSTYQDEQDGLFELARASGGKAIENANDLGLVFEAVEEDLGSYYLLGYYPQDATEKGRFRKIKVETERSGVRLDYRKGYYEEQPFERMTDAEKRLQLYQALEFDSAYTDLALTAAFEFFRGENGPVLAYSLGLHPRDLDAKGGRKASFAVVVQAMHRGEGKAAFEERKLELSVPPDAWKRMGSDPDARLRYASQMQLPPGDYDWKAVVRDEATGKMGSYKAELRIAGFEQPVQPSSLLVTAQAQPLAKRRKKDEGGGSVLDAAGYRLAPDSTRVVERGLSVWALYDLYNLPEGLRDKPPDAKLALVRGSERIAKLPISEYQMTPLPDGGVRYLARLETRTLPPGEYILAAMTPPRADGKSGVIYRRLRITPRAKK